MTSFICCPLPVRSAKRSRARFPYNEGGSGISCLDVRGCRMVISCRMRNKGGFRAPPRLPSDMVERQRAIELLGSFTQRKIKKAATIREIEALVGGLPKSREVAQQWKAMLQKSSGRKEHLANPSAFKHRKMILKEIRLPEQNAVVGRCFILLGCLQRRYRLQQHPSDRVVEELLNELGSYPTDAEETHHYIKTLVFLQAERRSRELRPPRIPLASMEELAYAKMLLGTYAVKGSIGQQSKHLEELIGTLPRNKNIAASWKKIVAAAIRKKKRKERAALRLAAIEHKRLVRTLRRQQRDLERSLAIPILKDSVVSHEAKAVIEPDSRKLLPTATAVREEIPVSPSKETITPNMPCFLRLQRLFVRIFGR